jgi:hypothetical protein
MGNWTSYKPNGEIHCVFTGTEPITAELEGFSYIGGAGDYETEFVDLTGAPVIASKVSVPFSQDKESITADAVDECSVTGLPDPCEVTWPDGEVDDVTGGEIDFSVDLPGDYVIKLKTPIHLETEVYIAANPVT